MSLLGSTRSRRVFGGVLALVFAVLVVALVKINRDASRINELEQKATRFDLHCSSVRSALIDASASFRSKEAHMRRQAARFFYHSQVASYRARDVFMCAERRLDEDRFDARYKACLGAELSLDQKMAGVERSMNHECLAKLADELRAELPRN